MTGDGEVDTLLQCVCAPVPGGQSKTAKVPAAPYVYCPPEALCPRFCNAHTARHVYKTNNTKHIFNHSRAFVARTLHARDTKQGRKEGRPSFRDISSRLGISGSSCHQRLQTC